MENNKKKLLIPIIIGVVVLIIIAVGITYAFFGVNNTASGTTNLEATTEEIGLVTVSNPTERLYLKLSAYEMQSNQQGTSYYATTDTEQNFETAEKNHTFAQYTISGGADDTMYKCSFKLNISKPSQIQTGDMSLKISLTDAKIGSRESLNGDLASLSNEYTVEFTRTGNGTGTLITGDLLFHNKNSQQNYLTDQTLITTLSVSDLSCSVILEEENTFDSNSGLYDENGTMTYTWEELLDNNYLEVIDGVLNAPVNYDEGYLIGGHLTGKLVIDSSVTAIAEAAFVEDNSFAGGMNFSSIVVPTSVTSIGGYAFSYSSISTIYYRGTEDEWNQINFSEEWNYDSSVNNIVYNYTD